MAERFGGDAPARALLFAPALDRYGVRLALVFGNHAPEGRCPYEAAGRCHHCDLGRGEGRTFDAAANLRRLAFFEAHYRDTFAELAHLVVYNSGSVLAPGELPLEVLGPILAFARALPSCRVVSLDSREAFVTRERVRWAAEALGPGRAVRPILGLETADTELRSEVLDKKMPERAVRRALAAIGEVGRALGRERVGVDVNVLVAGPGTSRERAVQDALRTARWAAEEGRRADLSVDLNLHPYYPSARGRARFGAHPRCSLSILSEVLRRSRAGWPELGLFVGVEDEGHDAGDPDGAAELKRASPALARFNATQDVRALEVLARVPDVPR